MRAAFTGLGVAFAVALALPGPASAEPCLNGWCEPTTTSIAGTPTIDPCLNGLCDPGRPPTNPPPDRPDPPTTIEYRDPPTTAEYRVTTTEAATTTTDLTEVGLPPVPTYARVSAQILTAPEGTVLPETGSGDTILMWSIVFAVGGIMAVAFARRWQR